MPDVIACPECGCIVDDPQGVVEDLQRELRVKRARITSLERGNEQHIDNAKRMPEARIVWEHWLKTFGKDSARWKFGKSRKEGVLRALGDYTVEELCEAISGCALDVWWRTNTKCDVETILKDAKRIDNFRDTFRRNG